ncbi:MAG: hypothetical protein ACXVFL_16605 [Solirubrobacteraceae bacterium]
MSQRRNPFALLGLAVVALLLVLAPAASAKSRDRNHDRIPDKWETKHHLSLRSNQARKDQDRDHMNNLAEYRAGTDPRNADSDGNGIKDGSEDSGTVVSFTPATATSPGSLTIKLYRNSSTLTGAVDNQTEVECDDSAQAPQQQQQGSPRDGGEGDNQQGDDNAQGDSSSSGPSQSQQGDDDGNDNEQGDDNDGEDGQKGSCSDAQLTPDAVVHEAQLSTTPDGLHFDKIKLVAAPSSSSSATS